MSPHWAPSPDALATEGVIGPLDSGSAAVLSFDLRMPRRTAGASEDGRTVADWVFPRLMQRDAPRRLLDEVRPAIDREDQ